MGGIPSIEHVDVSDNIIKRETDEICQFIKTSLGLKYLNLSDGIIKKQQQIKVFEAITENLSNPASKLEEFIWNQDPTKSLVKSFVQKLAQIKSTNLKQVEFTGVFMK